MIIVIGKWLKDVFFSSKIFNHKNLCLLFLKKNKGFQNLKPFIGIVGATGYEPVTPCL